MPLFSTAKGLKATNKIHNEEIIGHFKPQKTKFSKLIVRFTKYLTHFMCDYRITVDVGFKILLYLKSYFKVCRK